MLHWTCPRKEKEFSMLETVQHTTGCGRKLLLDWMVCLVFCSVVHALGVNEIKI